MGLSSESARGDSETARRAQRCRMQAMKNTSIERRMLLAMLLAARSLCRNVTIHEQHELWLDLEQGPALEGTAAGWLGIVATRYLAAMLERPLRTRRIEQKEGRLAVHALRSSDVPAAGMAEHPG
jgi:hypothetical protein